jgi:two-component system, OmpR family, response regulator NblR
MTTSVLLVCADKELALNLQRDLEQVGYQCDWSILPKEVYQRLDQQVYDLALIDRQFAGDASGLVLCRTLREQGKVLPLLLMMSHDSVEDRIACLESGADDYLVQPCSAEMLVQIARPYLQPPASSGSGEFLRFDSLILDIGTRTAIRSGRPISLTTKEYDLLKYLMEHPREALPREKILEKVWGYDFTGASNVIEVYIRYLRLKIEADGEKKLIHTVRGVGYVLRDI